MNAKPISFADIVDAARNLACTATEEHPGYVRIKTLNGRVAAVGTVNGPWEADIFNNPTEEEELRPALVIKIPDSHNKTAEGIARYVAGTMAGLHEWTAYPTEREMLKAKRAERKARDGR